MNDITALVQRLELAAAKGCCHTLLPDDCRALVEALEKAQRSNEYLREQSAEWERKAISNFEECVEMSARIEELESQRKLAFTAGNRWADKFREAERRIAELEVIHAAAEKLVRCKGRYHSEQNYRALAALFGVKTPDLPPMEGESHTVTVKLPKLYGIDFCDRIVPDSGNGFLFYSEQVVEILAAAGIQVIEGEG